MIRNPEAESFFSTLSAHSDVATEFLAALKRLGEYDIRHAPGEYGAVFAVAKDIVFCGAASMNATYWRLRPKDVQTALSSGAQAVPIGGDWVVITCFRADWPNPDLPFWALRAYDFARTGV